MRGRDDRTGRCEYMLHGGCVKPVYSSERRRCPVRRLAAAVRQRARGVSSTMGVTVMVTAVIVSVAPCGPVSGTTVRESVCPAYPETSPVHATIRWMGPQGADWVAHASDHGNLATLFRLPSWRERVWVRGTGRVACSSRSRACTRGVEVCSAYVSPPGAAGGRKLNRNALPQRESEKTETLAVNGFGSHRE